MRIKERNTIISEGLERFDVSCGACNEAFCCKETKGISCSKQEWKEIKKHITPEIKKKGEKIVGQKIYDCPFLNKENKCLIYSIRPIVCVIYLVKSNMNLCNSKLLPTTTVEFFSPMDILTQLQEKGLISIKEQLNGKDFRDWFKK